MNKQFTLYELVDQYNQITDAIEKGEDLSILLGKINEDLEHKAENIAKLILNIEAEFDACENERKRFTDKKQVARNKIEKLKEYLLLEMKEARKEKIKRDLFTISIRTNSASIEVLDDIKVPPQFKHIELVIEKQKILENFKETGEIVPGVNILTDKQRIEIR